MFVDSAAERLRVVQRAGRDDWAEAGHDAPVDLMLPSPGVTLPHAETFAR